MDVKAADSVPAIASLELPRSAAKAFNQPAAPPEPSTPGAPEPISIFGRSTPVQQQSGSVINPAAAASSAPPAPENPGSAAPAGPQPPSESAPHAPEAPVLQTVDWTAELNRDFSSTQASTLYRAAARDQSHMHLQQVSPATKFSLRA